MKWTIKLVAEVVAGKTIEHEIAMIERPVEISPGNVGLTIEEGKAILESLQNEVVTAQVQQHGVNIRSCPRCGSAFRTKGYYRSTLRSVYGKVGMRIRRLGGCSCSGSQGRVSPRFSPKKSPLRRNCGISQPRWQRCCRLERWQISSASSCPCLPKRPPAQFATARGRGPAAGKRQRRFSLPT